MLTNRTMALKYLKRGFEEELAFAREFFPNKNALISFYKENISKIDKKLADLQRRFSDDD